MAVGSGPAGPQLCLGAHPLYSGHRITGTVFPRKDVAATIYFSATATWRLFEGGAYSMAAFNSVTGTHV